MNDNKVYHTEDPLYNDPRDPRNDGRESSNKFVQFMMGVIVIAMTLSIVLSLVKVLLPYAILGIIVFCVTYFIAKKLQTRKDAKKREEDAKNLAAKAAKKYEGVSQADPTIKLVGLASAGNIAANQIIKKYHELEDLALDNAVNVNNLRAEYEVKFDSVRQLIDLCADAKAHPETYDDPDGLLRKTSKAINSLIKEMVDREKDIKKSHVVMAEAAMDYLNSTDEDITSKNNSAPVKTVKEADSKNESAPKTVRTNTF